MRAPAPALQPQVPAAPSKATLAAPSRLVALKSFRDRLQRAQASAAQARNAVVLKPAVGQSQPSTPSKAPNLPAFPRPAHRNEPPRLESPGSATKLLAMPASRPEPKPMAEARPQLAMVPPPRPEKSAAPALASATSAPAPVSKAKVQAQVPSAGAQPGAAQTTPTPVPTARVEVVKSEKPAAPVPARSPEPSVPQATPSVPASPSTIAGATITARGDDAIKSASGSATRKDQKVAGLETAVARPLHREEMLREIASPWTRPQPTPLETQTSSQSQSEGGSGGGAGGGGGHHQGGSGGGSEGGGRGQSGEEIQLELDWLGGADDALAFSVELRDLQFRPRSGLESEQELPTTRARRNESDEQGEQQSPPRRRRRQWEEEEEDQQEPVDQSDCAPARLICRPDSEFVAVARHWLARPELRHFTLICPGEVSSMGIIRLRDFPPFESGHQRVG